MKKFLMPVLTTVVAIGTIQAAPLNVPSGGLTVDFATAPVGGDFYSLSVGASAAGANTVLGVDANGMDNPTTGVSHLLALPATNTDWTAAANLFTVATPPAHVVNGTPRYASNGKLLFGPTGNTFGAVIGAFVNGSGSNVTNFEVKFDSGVYFASAGTGGVGTDPLAGLHLYASPTGAIDSWVRVSGPHTAEAVTQTVVFSPAITNGGLFYLAIVDDNGPASNTPPNLEGDYTLDNLMVTPKNLSLSPAISSVVRNDNGTPYNPADDTVSFSLTVTSAGAVSPSGWKVTSGPLNATTGAYNTPKALTLPIASFTGPAHLATVPMQDADNAGAAASANVTAPWCVITATIISANYSANNTVIISYSANAVFGGSTYTADTVAGSQPGNLYSAPYTVSVAPGATYSITVTDTLDPTCTASISGRAPGAIGTNNTGAVSVPIIGSTATAGTLWTIDSAARTLTQVSGTQGDHIVNSSPIDLTTVGTVILTANLDAIAGTPTTTSSGFEALDSFTMQVMIDGGDPISILGPHDTDNTGRLEGGATSPSELPAADILSETRPFGLSYIIPASANSVVIRIIGNSNSPNETLLVRDITLSPAPDYAGYTFNAVSGKPTKIGLGKILRKVTTPSGVPATIAGSGPAASGGSTLLGINDITYISAVGHVGADSFLITILDNASGIALDVTVNVNVTPAPSGLSMNQSTVKVNADGSRDVTFMGIPGFSYIVQRTTDMLSWTNLQTVAAEANGTITLTDSAVIPGGSAFYRTAQVRP